MQRQTLGKTGLQVGRLGFGGARIAYDKTPLDRVEVLLNTLLDGGVNFFDTAVTYLNSEELIYRFVGGRRDEFVLATKCSPLSGGATVADWSHQAISDSIDTSLRRFATDCIDLIQFHSCTAEVLRHGEAVEALLRARDAGKTRFVGYSGDGRHALEAIRMGIFDTLQTSFNIVDQRALADVLPAAEEAGMGVIAKRPIANASLGKEAAPSAYAEPYWKRAQQFQIPEGAPEDPMELSLRFTLSHDVIDTAIVGTTHPAHARQNIKAVAAGPLPSHVLDALYNQFRQFGGDWNQMN